MNKRKIPFRKCVGCKEQKSKNELIRVVKSKDGEISLDLSGKKNGRGAYICKDIDCLEKAYKSKSLNRSLSTNIEEDIYNEMMELLKSE